MGMKEQLRTLKDNWLLIVLVLVAFVVFTSMSGLVGLFSMSTGSSGLQFASDANMEKSMAYYGGGRAIYYDDGFAPEIEDRIITKTAWLTTEVNRGEFHASEARLKSIITTSDSYLLNENVYKYGTERKQYYSGSYQIKVDTEKYDSVLAQIKEIGEVQSFSENKDDITASYTDAKIELEVEKERLARYEAMYAEATKVEDKINLNDRIFDQERKIKYMEDAIKSMDQRVDYSTLSVTLREKQSDYADVAVAKISELVKSLVGSFNVLLYFMFVIVPWAVLAGLIWLIVKIARRH